MPADALFLYGTLCHPPLYQAVAAAPLRARAARLPDHAVTQARAHGGTTLDFPLFTPRMGAVARGLVVTPDPAARARLDAYERVFGYDPAPVTVESITGPLAATIYLPREAMWTPGADWSLEGWVEAHGALRTEIAAEVMALLDAGISPEQVLHRYPMLSAHVASRGRARAQAASAVLRREPGPDDVELVARRHPYNWFFGLIEDDLRFRRFDDALSAPVNRAAFVMADAVTVLPYDPVRDCVLMVEQFRMGPFTRGDANPWTLECIAGRIDAGETPEAAARREAAEEAGLDLGAMHKVAEYYPSPGAVTEYLYSYVALASLPDGAVGLHGLASEAEDIRTHIVPFARLAELIDSGELANGPLLTSVFWLMAQRDRLRAR